MGAINYGNGNIINIGYKDKETDADAIKCSYVYDDVENILQDLQNMDYYKINIKSGYYAGFYIELSRDVYYLDNADERVEMLAEWEQIYNTLKTIITENGLRVYGACGWLGCSRYDKRGSLKELKKANKAERVIIAQYKLDADFTSFAERMQYINACRL